MTAMKQGTSPQMSVDEFEQIAAFAEREIETVRFEFLGGRIRARKGVNGNHGSLVTWLVRHWMETMPGLGLYPSRGLKVEACRQGRVLPDGVLAPTGHFKGHGDWSDPDGVLMTLEVTSSDPGTHTCDRVEKPRAYAEAGIPLYLLVDRDDRRVAVHSDPDPEDGYRDIHVVRLGGKVTLPDPVGIELDTEELKQYAG
ncbi:Uma2 family endonuclease [Streptomyces shenzhenensis]|uniref:Uma2 family endonuclease n=1 Tax=Streptomyces shenzhenensis TaxID=943815 RepID=UPI0015F09863|nr:Uma2 family endonuclease [Streptomyces shenzhenensis]